MFRCGGGVLNAGRGDPRFFQVDDDIVHLSRDVCIVCADRTDCTDSLPGLGTELPFQCVGNAITPAVWQLSFFPAQIDTCPLYRPPDNAADGRRPILRAFRPSQPCTRLPVRQRPCKYAQHSRNVLPRPWELMLTILEASGLPCYHCSDGDAGLRHLFRVYISTRPLRWSRVPPQHHPQHCSDTEEP